MLEQQRLATIQRMQQQQQEIQMRKQMAAMGIQQQPMMMTGYAPGQQMIGGMASAMPPGPYATQQWPPQVQYDPSQQQMAYQHPQAYQSLPQQGFYQTPQHHSADSVGNMAYQQPQQVG